MLYFILQYHIYSITGRRVKTLVDERVSKGYHEVKWNGVNKSGSQTSSGVYLYELRMKGKTASGKMTLVR